MPPRMLAALMCEKLHQPPSVILNEDYDELLWMWNTLVEVENLKAKMNIRQS